MGILLSITTKIVDFAGKVKLDKKKDKIEKDKDKKDAILKPITPPQFYKTIEERNKNVKSGPYSTKGIVESLKQDLIPVGYSLEQLEEVGFGANVEEFRKQRNEDNKNNRKNLVDGLEEIRDKLKGGLIDSNDLSQSDKDLMRKYKIFDPGQQKIYLGYINNWIDLAKKDLLDEKVLDNMISFLSLKTEDIQDALKEDDIRKQNKAIVDKAVNEKDARILRAVQRAFSHGLGIERI